MTNLVRSVYNGTVQTVKIGDLKAQLSAYLQRVQKGEEVLVCDRSTPVARIVPVRLKDQSAQERRLIARGILVPPEKKRPAAWPEPPGNVSGKVMERVWREERENR
jgi:prevent-host-death family protein